MGVRSRGGRSGGPKQRSPPPAATPGPVPHTYQGCGAASPQLTGRGDAGMAWRSALGAGRGAVHGPGPRGRAAPMARRAQARERQPRAAKRALGGGGAPGPAGPSERERGGGGSAGRSPHRALPAGGKTRPGSPRLERDSPLPAASLHRTWAPAAAPPGRARRGLGEGEGGGGRGRLGWPPRAAAGMPGC